MSVSMIGWVATAVFASSYLFNEAATLRKIQAAAACLWIVYGVLIGALPVIVANVIVAGVAVFTAVSTTTRAKPSLDPRATPATPELPLTQSPQAE